MHMFIAALTGNYGMGKSSALSLFRNLGAVTLDSDRIVALLLNEKNVIRRVRDILGDGVLGTDGKLDKKAVAAVIFQDEALKNKLEGLLHPLVFARIDEFLSKIRNRNCVVVVEVPLLFEGNYEGRFSKVITVYTSEETAIERLLRSGVSRAEAESRLRAQLAIEEKKARSDYAIDNNGTKEETAKQVEAIYRTLLEEAAA